MADGGGGEFDVESLWQACERLPEAAGADPLIGRLLGEVTLTRFIAEGGMGRVYEAEQANPARRVAVKVLRPGLFTRETIRRFVREVTTLGSLQHPSITQVYSAGTYEIAGTELPYFVMELIHDALPLTEYAKTRHLAVAERLGLFRQVCDAIAYGHERGVVHRDLKPGNLLVDGLGRPKVIDFGVARCAEVGAVATTLTEAGQLIGTLQYMSPEQVTGRSGNVDARADVYSLGMVLYELLAGVPPYDLNGRSLVEAARIVHEQRPRPLRGINPAVPRNVAAIVQKCLAKDPALRFQTGGELAAALDSTGESDSGMLPLFLDAIHPSPDLRRVAIAGLASVAAILGVVYWMPASMWPARLAPAPRRPMPPAAAGVLAPRAIKPPNVEAVADPAAALMLQQAEIHRDAKTFRFALRDVHQRGADTFLVENVGMKRWIDQFMFPRVSYWAPEKNNQEGTLVYRFDFGGVAESIHLQVVSNCWDFFHEPGGVGRGASAIEVSRDGTNWITIQDNIEPRRWGVTITVDQKLPDAVLRATTLWLRVRCLTESAPVENGYNVAQFARTRPGRPEPVFEVAATLRED